MAAVQHSADAPHANVHNNQPQQEHHPSSRSRSNSSRGSRKAAVGPAAMQSVTAATAAALTAGPREAALSPLGQPVHGAVGRGDGLVAAGSPEANVPEAVDHEVSSSELLKWSEMMEAGIGQYRLQHPDRFHRRVRRGIPPKFRWQVWKMAVGVDTHDLPHDYERLSRAESKWTSLIEIDIGRTFPELKEFGNEKQQKLFRVLNAYAAHNPEVGYCQGMNFVAGLLLLVSDCEEESFNVLACIMDGGHVGLCGFYASGLPLLKKYLMACDKMVAEAVPELREHFKNENIQAAVYLHQWFLTLFINCFPLSMVLIIWDVIVCEGLPVILRIAVSILQVLKDSLMSMHFEEIIKFFKMMKTYEDEEGDLNAFRIGQLLMKHTEHVVISEKVMQYLSQPEEGPVEFDEYWEGEQNGTWFQTFSRIFAFPSGSRGRGRLTDSRPATSGGSYIYSSYTSYAYGGSSAASGSRSSPAAAEAAQQYHHQQHQQRAAASSSGASLPAFGSYASHSSHSHTAREQTLAASSASASAAPPASERGGGSAGVHMPGLVGGPTRGYSQSHASRDTTAEEDRGWEFL